MAAKLTGEQPEISSDEAPVLLPILQQKPWLAEVQKQTDAVPVHRSFLTGLIVTYILDSPHYRTYLNETMLGETAIKEMSDQGIAIQDAVHESALSNLRTHLNTLTIEPHGSFRETIITCETQDGYATSVILLPEVMTEWQKKIPGDMLIGIPNRDFVIAFSSHHPSDVAGIERQIQHNMSTRKHPLVGRLLTWKDDAIRDYKPLN